MTFVFHEWLPYRLTLRPRTPPNGGSFEQLDAYAAHLQGLGLPDPTKSSARRVAAEHVAAEAERYSATAARPALDMAARLEDGSLTPKAAAKQFASMPDAKEAEAAVQKVRAGMETQVNELLHLAARSIYEYPDWLRDLQALATQAIEKRDAKKLSRVFAFAEWLRSVGALSIALQNSNQSCEAVLYSVADPRALFHWRLANSDPRHVVPGAATALPGGGHIVPIVLSPRAALPTVTDYAAHPEWRPGLYSAEEVVEAQARALDEQDREIAALMGRGDVAPRRAVTA